MNEAETRSTWNHLIDFGFQPDSELMSDVMPGLSFDFGNLKLSASCVIGKYFQEVVLFLGNLITPRTFSEVDFEMPREGVSREQCAAWIAWHLDKAADRGVFVPTKEASWLNSGRQNKHLLPWEIERSKAERKMAAYNARPRCTVQREWLKLALKKFAEHLALAADAEIALFDFDGTILSIRFGEQKIVVAAEGDPWPFNVVISAGSIRNLPKRLMNGFVDVSVWKSILIIGRCRYEGAVTGLYEP